MLELAWMTGLISWSEDPHPGWFDAEGNEVAETEQATEADESAEQADDKA